METGEVVRLLRLQRHDFANYMQVLRGYLELGQPSRALEYLESAAHEIGIESRIFSLGDDELALFLFRQRIEAREFGLSLDIGDVVLAGPGNDRLWFDCSQALKEMFPYAAGTAEKMILSIVEDGGSLRLKLQGTDPAVLWQAEVKR